MKRKFLVITKSPNGVCWSSIILADNLDGVLKRMSELSPLFEGHSILTIDPIQSRQTYDVMSVGAFVV